MLQVTLSLRGMGVAPLQLRRSLSGVRVFCGRHDASERLIVMLSGFRRWLHSLQGSLPLLVQLLLAPEESCGEETYHIAQP